MIHTGDCIEVMAGMEAESVDAVVTDPPYGLEFMGKRWDAFKSPGRGARVSTERADELTPRGKGHTTSKGPFLAAGVDQYIAGAPFQAWCTEWATEALRVTKPGGYLLAFGGTRTHHRLVCGLEDAGWIIRDELEWIYASGFPKGKANLKPAHEPIVLARKPGPLRPLDIEETRITHRPGEVDFEAMQRQSVESAVYVGGAKPGDEIQMHKESGRWPSNLLLSDPELFDEPNPEVVGSGATASFNEPVEWKSDGDGIGQRVSYHNGVGARNAGDVRGAYGDTGGYSRFFIIPKSSRSDREPVVTPDGHDRSKRFSTHPTQKPTDLMAHLIRLVCPLGGVILDPFLGSGSTAVAAEREGVKWIGIEKEPEYVAIAEARLNGTQRGLGLDVPAPVKQRKLMTEEEAAERVKSYKGHATYSGGWGWEDDPQEAA